MTNDTDFLRLEGGADLINDIALFWASRVEYDEQTKLYHINGKIRLNVISHKYNCWIQMQMKVEGDIFLVRLLKWHKLLLRLLNFYLCEKIWY